ncbi:MAG TPA: SDR family oxidoreductase [Pirellulaceae bacterium]|nr:SDR family oxidoreductase [Pirellulaceae bacterium]
MSDARAVVIVVGGTTGIGAAIVERLLAEHHAVVSVGLAGSASEAAEGEATERAAGVEQVIGDARSVETIDRAIAVAIASAERRSVAIAGLIHVAGGSGRSLGDGPLDAITDSGWSGTLDWNLGSVFLSNRAIVRHWLATNSGGSVVNLGSVLARSPAPEHFATHAYAAAKAGLIGLTTACAAHYAPHDLRFNAILPGLIDTPMARRAIGDPTIRDYLQRKQPLRGGGPGHPDDVAALATWLVSPAARWITGQTIAVDGGWSVSEG